MSKQAGKSVIMLTIYLFASLLFIFIADGAVEDYRFVSEINGYLKLHRIPAKWQNARLRCHLEGGVLASPTNPNDVSAMKEILSDSKFSAGRVYTGIHATYSNGDYTTITGIPLSMIDVEWEQGEPNNVEGNQNCLIMHQSGKLAVVNCDTDHPYFCYKSMEKANAHECHPDHDGDYKYNNLTGSCYKFHKEGRSWSKAFMTCMAEDAYLAIINSRLESEVIRDLFEKNPHYTISGDFHKDAASIGFTKWKDLGEWFTIRGEPLIDAGFAIFNEGEPNNIGGNEWCGSVWRNGFLNDHFCDRLLTFICEKTPYKYEEGDN